MKDGGMDFVTFSKSEYYLPHSLNSLNVRSQGALFVV